MNVAGITVDKLRKSANNGLAGGFGDGWLAQSLDSGARRNGLI
jgi:hypothetical protein